MNVSGKLSFSYCPHGRDTAGAGLKTCQQKLFTRVLIVCLVLVIQLQFVPQAFGYTKSVNTPHRQQQRWNWCGAASGQMVLECDTIANTPGRRRATYPTGTIEQIQQVLWNDIQTHIQPQAGTLTPTAWSGSWTTTIRWGTTPSTEKAMQPGPVRSLRGRSKTTRFRPRSWSIAGSTGSLCTESIQVPYRRRTVRTPLTDSTAWIPDTLRVLQVRTRIGHTTTSSVCSTRSIAVRGIHGTG